MSYDLLIEARTKSKAKILGIPAKSFLEGEEYSASFTITNIGTKSFPGGGLKIEVKWPTDQVVEFSFTLPKIMPNNSFITEEDVSNVLSKGYGLFSCNLYSSDQTPIRSFRNREKPIHMSLGESFHSVYGKSHEEIYEFWGMLIAAFSLLIIALEKVVQFFLWIFSRLS